MPLPSQTTAYVETTIVADTLLKSGTGIQAQAKKALASFTVREVPQYSLREFKSVLSYYAWIHNCFVEEQSLSGALARIHAVMRRGPGRAATSIEAVFTQLPLLSKSIDPRQAIRMGIANDPDGWMADELRIALNTLITKAWMKRVRIAKVVQTMACYSDKGPALDGKGLITIPDKVCKTSDCALRSSLQANKAALQAVLKASDTQLPLAEASRRSKVIRQLVKGKPVELSPQACRSLGDAVFAIMCPPSSAILTTNTRDHRLLAGALGKTAVSPNEVLAP